jgi:hypothetical protein
MALVSMALLGSTPIGGPIVGSIAEHANPRLSLLIGGLAALVAAAYGWRNLRTDDTVEPIAFAEPALAS